VSSTGTGQEGGRSPDLEVGVTPVSTDRNRALAHGKSSVRSFTSPSSASIAVDDSARPEEVTVCEVCGLVSRLPAAPVCPACGAGHG
jgi:hypothetical protein